MFGRNDKQTTTVSEYLGKKSRLITSKKRIIHSKITYALGGEHKHLYGKQDILENNENARCKICNLLLSEYRVQKKIENWTPHLKPIRKTSAQAEK